MNTDNINLVLAQMETSLKELDSARKQVDKVAESGSNLTSATTTLIQEVKLFADKIGNETTAIIANFSEKLSDFDKKLIITADAGQKDILAEVEKFRISTIDLKETAENSINEIESLSTRTIKEQESKISETINSISSYCTQLQSLIEKLSELEFNNQLNKLDANISGIHTMIENGQTSIENELITSSEKQTTSFSNLQEKVDQSINALLVEMKASTKKQQINSFITWVMIILGVLSIFLILK